MLCDHTGFSGSLQAHTWTCLTHLTSTGLGLLKDSAEHLLRWRHSYLIRHWSTRAWPISPADGLYLESKVSFFLIKIFFHFFNWARNDFLCLGSEEDIPSKSESLSSTCIYLFFHNGLECVWNCGIILFRFITLRNFCRGASLFLHICFTRHLE